MPARPSEDVADPRTINSNSSSNAINDSLNIATLLQVHLYELETQSLILQKGSYHHADEGWR